MTMMMMMMIMLMMVVVVMVMVIFHCLGPCHVQRRKAVLSCVVTSTVGLAWRLSTLLLKVT